MAHLGERKWTHVFPFLVVGIYVCTGCVFANIYSVAADDLGSEPWYSDWFPFIKTPWHGLLKVRLLGRSRKEKDSG